ncbi:MAG: ATP-dependent helicase [Phycisphaerae bacterium]|nr:ATP-dependent helicase [Phycisphaerae bacterium]
MAPSPDKPLAWLNDLNPQQRAAATAGDGPILVVAGAGTGKTKTLAYRVAWLVSQGVDPSRIMLLTFTRRASEEMIRRATAIVRRAMEGRKSEEDASGGAEHPHPASADAEADLSQRERFTNVGTAANPETRDPITETLPSSNPQSEIRNPKSDSLHRVWGGTFHSVANRLLRVYGKAIDLDPGFTVIDQGDAEDLMNVVRYELHLADKAKRFPRKSTCLAIYSRTVNSSDPLDYTLKTYFPWCQEWGAELKQLFSAYVDAKGVRNVLDYDDLLLFWFHLLGDEGLADKIGARFGHVLVDEYQDTNRLQAGILQRLRKTNKNVMVVGDDAQSIYSFRAADIHNILDFPKQFPGTVQITLEQNYRSRQPILDATNGVIAKSKKRFTKDLWSSRLPSGGEQKPYLITCEREEEQTDFVVKKILEHYEQGLPLKKIAVLFRTSHWADLLEVELTRRNIPYHKFGGLKFLEAAHVKDLLSFLRILENPRDQLAWSRVLILLEGVGPGTAARAYQHVERNSYDPLSIESFSFPTAARQPACLFASLLHDLLDAGRRVPLAGQIERIRRFYEPLFENIYENPEPRRRDLEQIEHIAAGYTGSRSRQKFLTDLTLDPPSSTSDLAGPPTLDDDWMTLSTIHSAKGCEWDVVFMIHATDGIIPSDLSTGDADQIEEERRLLYVACTRAKDWLYVLFPLRYYYRKHRFGDSHGYAQLTRFITPDLKPLFEELAVSREQSEDGEAGGQSGTTAKDIRKNIRSMWD